MDGISSALGQGASWLGSNMPSFLGGAQGSIGSGLQNWGQNIMPADPNIISSALGATPSPSLSPYFTGGTSTDPNAPVDPSNLALPAASAMGPTGGVGFNPAGATEAAFTGLPGTTDPVTSGPLGPALGDPASSTTANVLAALGLGGTGGATGTAATGTGAAGAAGQPSLLASILKMSPSVITGLLKYQQQQSLLNQNSLQQAEQNALKGQKAALEKSIFPGVTAQLQETGQINAPYLATQAYTTAIAPYVQQAQQAAMENWLRANQIALGLYPSDSEAGLVGTGASSIFGGSA